MPSYGLSGMTCGGYHVPQAAIDTVVSELRSRPTFQMIDVEAALAAELRRRGLPMALVPTISPRIVRDTRKAGKIVKASPEHKYAVWAWA